MHSKGYLMPKLGDVGVMRKDRTGGETSEIARGDQGNAAVTKVRGMQASRLCKAVASG